VPSPQKILLIVVTLACAHITSAQQSTSQSWFTRYEQRVAAAQVNQPRWATPFITTSPRIEQDIRADFVRQSLTGSQSTWNLGNTKGFQLIPFRRTEIRIRPPPYILHSVPQISDGFGDTAFRLKYRLYSSDEEHHNAVATIMLAATIPTGKKTNGSCCATLSPILSLGKGFGRFAFITNFSASLPASNTLNLGRQVIFNNVVEFHAARYIWFQTEVNSTLYKGGRNNGKTQTFLTPGITFARLPLSHDASGAPGPFLLTLGYAEQIAVTHFNTYNHSPVFTMRFRF
jgi:hypothetical protein